MPKIYRTMQGDQIDIEALFQKNELAVAVGNMQANARGDELGPGGVIVKTREQKAREYYLRQKARKAAEANPSARLNDEPKPAQESPSEELVTAQKSDINGPTELSRTPDTVEDPDGIEGLE